MPESAPRRRLLPLLGVGGGRSPKTCLYRCGNACFHPAPNKSDNPYFGDIFQGVLSRRTALKGAAVGAGASALGLAALSPAAADRAPNRPHPSPRPAFQSVQPNTDDAVTVPEGYDHHVIVRWGDAVEPDAPEFDFENQTGEAQAKQFGYNCDYVGFHQLDDDHGLLWVNHEYTNEELMFAGYTDGNDADLEQIKVAIAAHGGSILELERQSGTGEWRLAQGDRPFNRRITGNTPFRISGPAAGHELLRTEADPEIRNGVLPVMRRLKGRSPSARRHSPVPFWRSSSRIDPPCAAMATLICSRSASLPSVYPANMSSSLVYSWLTQSRPWSSSSWWKPT